MMDEARFKCNSCGKVFERKDWLDSHVREKCNRRPPDPHLEGLKAALRLIVNNPKSIIDCDIYYSKNIAGKICHVQFNMLLREDEVKENADRTS